MSRHGGSIVLARNSVNLNQIKVMLRIRPSSKKERGNPSSKNVFEIIDEESVVFDPNENNDLLAMYSKKRQPKNLQFSYDHIFGPETTTDEIYDQSIRDVINHLQDGYNCTIFAYGGTGAGKTFTMLGTPVHPGLTALLAEELYSTLMEDGIGVEIICSYLEIYNENVHDLLSDIHPPKALQLLEDGSSVVVSDLSWFRPSNAEELMSILRTGNLRRSQLPTDTNKESSRSHAIFQVAVSLKRRFGTFCSKLCLVDLAGSDRASLHTDMRRRVEGANINKSLLALGSCIDALADGLQHVPFRNSKLTRLLKNSLDGNCRTIMIANVSPSSLAYDDTFSTLKYAARVKYIKNSVKKNLVSARNASVSARDLEAAKVEIALLQMEIESLRVENRDLKTTVKEHVCVAPEFRDRLQSCSPVNEPDDDDDLPFTTRNKIYSDPGCRSSLQSSGSVFEEPGMSLEKPRPRSESSYEIPRTREPLSRRSTETLEIDSPKSTFREHTDVIPEFRDYSQSWLAEPKQQRSVIVPIVHVQERQVYRDPNPNTERRQSLTKLQRAANQIDSKTETKIDENQNRIFIWIALLVASFCFLMLFTSILVQRWVVSGAKHENPEFDGFVQIGIYTGKKSFNVGQGWNTTDFQMGLESNSWRVGAHGRQRKQSKC
ncbi:Hypothetical predicted protein [Cloeon dipterum]|uniref:Kinesin motor domain-containing protein n=1 Tax=Cloeon dipterum TaxID=197152 RepID=A0A8S1CHT2_9INSE|nr:Hypothetical predicted protein [Cloeon dipterum]